MTTQAQPPPPPADAGLWCGKKIPIIGVTGEFGSGKTLFALSIDPNCFSTDRSIAPTTLHWDTEGSAESFADALHFEHRPLNKIMVGKFLGGYKPVNLFQHWLADMRATPPGRYRVGILDTVSEIEDGLVAYVRAHPEEFGYTRQQFAKMEGLVWGAVKAYWKRILTEAEARFETFCFTSHMKAVWRGNTTIPGQRTAKGKETLWELASLYLKLDRTAKPGAKKVPAKPSGEIFHGKNRLVHFDPRTGELRPILPPHLPEATPRAIRAYIRNPVDYGNLRVSERAVAQEMSAEEKLAIEAGIATDRAAAAQAELSRVELMKKAATEQARSMATAAARQPPSANGPMPTPPKPDTRTAADFSGRQTDRCTQAHVEQIRALFQQCGATPDTAAEVLHRRGVEYAVELSVARAEELIGALRVRAAFDHIDASLAGNQNQAPREGPQKN